MSRGRSSAHGHPPWSSDSDVSARAASTRGDERRSPPTTRPPARAGGGRQPFRPPVLRHQDEGGLTGSHGPRRELEVVLAQEPEVPVQVGERSQHVDVAELEHVEAPVGVADDDDDVQHPDPLRGHHLLDGRHDAAERGSVGEDDEEVLDQVGRDVVGPVARALARRSRPPGRDVLVVAASLRRREWRRTTRSRVVVVDPPAAGWCRPTPEPRTIGRSGRHRQ